MITSRALCWAASSRIRASLGRRACPGHYHHPQSMATESSRALHACSGADAKEPGQQDTVRLFKGEEQGKKKRHARLTRLGRCLSLPECCRQDAFAFTNPIELFQRWYDEAKSSELSEPNAICLTSVSAAGKPSSRMVLLKVGSDLRRCVSCRRWRHGFSSLWLCLQGIDDRGFVFYTNLESRKGTELRATPFACFCVHWKSLDRQIRVEGREPRCQDEHAELWFFSLSSIPPTRLDSTRLDSTRVFFPIELCRHR